VLGLLGSSQANQIGNCGCYLQVYVEAGSGQWVSSHSLKIWLSWCFSLLVGVSSPSEYRFWPAWAKAVVNFLLTLWMYQLCVVKKLRYERALRWL